MKFNYQGQEISLQGDSGSFREREFLEYIQKLGLRGTYVEIGSTAGENIVFFSLLCSAEKVFGYETEIDQLAVTEQVLRDNNIGSNCHLKTVTSTGIEGGTVSAGLDNISCICISADNLSNTVFNEIVELCSDHKPLLFIGKNVAPLTSDMISALSSVGYTETGKDIGSGNYIEYSDSDFGHKKYFDVAGYWDKRYLDGRDSGSGSYNRLAKFKADYLNKFVASRSISSIVELGCGDGAQLELSDYPSYTGLDISPEIIRVCQGKFGRDNTKRFLVYTPEGFSPEEFKSELSLSLDVIYHLSNDDIYRAYLKDLFAMSTKYVVVFANSSNLYHQGVNERSEYVRFRDFLQDVESQFPDWVLTEAEPNKYPFNVSIPNITSFADFYVFEKAESNQSALESFDSFSIKKIGNQLVTNAEQVDLLVKSGTSINRSLKDSSARIIGINEGISDLEQGIDSLSKDQKLSNKNIQSLIEKINNKVEIVEQENYSLKLERDSLQKELQLAKELPLLANNMQEKIWELIDERAGEKNQIEALLREVEKLKSRVLVSETKRSGHYSKLESERSKNLQLAALFDQLSQEYMELAADLATTEEKLYLQQHSLTNQLGIHLKKAMSLKGLLRFPLAMFRVYKTYKLRKARNFKPFTAELRLPETRYDHPETKVEQKPKPFKPKQKINQHKLQAGIIGWPQGEVSNNKLSVLAVMDEFTTGCFKADINLVQPRPDNWQALYTQAQPKMVFIESAWKGNFGSWQYRVATYSNKPGDELQDLATYAQTEKVPVVFWNKEDPVHHEKFMEAAKKADIIFTTDENMVKSYKQKTDNDKVYPLPFAAQPELHKPAGLTGRINKSCFAGSWYGNRHAERGEAMAWLLEAAAPYGLDIYDRNYGAGIFPFPEKYKEGIKGSLPYTELCKEYSKYRVFLNVNSVTDSPTMFSRRVFELMACGTPVVSTYAKGIEKLLGTDSVWLVNSPEEAKQAISTLMTDDEEWRRRSLSGIRTIFSAHTYQHRLEYIYSKCAIDNNQLIEPALAIFAKVDNESQLSLFVEMLSEIKIERRQVFVELPNTISTAVPKEIGAISSIENQINKIAASDNQYLCIIDTSEKYKAGTFEDLMNATVYAPEAIAWGKSATEQKFVMGGAVDKHCCIWRASEFDYQSFISDGNVIQQDRIYAMDTNG